MQVLAIERGADFRAVPRGEDRFQAGDRLVVFGRAEAIEVVETDEPLEAIEAAGRA